jgi:hypothetical protein
MFITVYKHLKSKQLLIRESMESLAFLKCLRKGQNENEGNGLSQKIQIFADVCECLCLLIINHYIMRKLLLAVDINHDVSRESQQCIFAQRKLRNFYHH